MKLEFLMEFTATLRRPSDTYFMTTPRFETCDERYSWVNDLVRVAEGKILPEGPAYRVQQ